MKSGKIILLNFLKDAGLEFLIIRNINFYTNDGDIDILVKDSIEIENVLLKKGGILFNKNSYNSKIIINCTDTGWWIHFDIFTRIKFHENLCDSKYIEYLFRKSIIGIHNFNYLDTFNANIINNFHYAFDKYNSTKIKHIIYDNILHNNILINYNFLEKELLFYIKLFNYCSSRRLNKYLMKKILINKSLLSLFFSRFNSIVKRFLSLFKIRIQIVLLGPDGSGKTTLSEKLIGLKWPFVIRQYMGPNSKSSNSPFFSLILNFLDRIRFNSNKTSFIGLLSRIIWHFVCYIDLLVRVLKNQWKICSGNIVIFDRYACDLYIRKPGKILEFLYVYFFPKPQLVILCRGDASKIISRKRDELSEEMVFNTYSNYVHMFQKHKFNYIEINTTSNSPSENISQIVNIIINLANE